MASFVAGSRKVASAAERGSGSLLAILLTMSRVAGPERRKTAIAARPAPEAMAKMVSVSIAFDYLSHCGTAR